MPLLVGSPERVSAQLDLEQAVQQMASDCAAGVANHETYPLQLNIYLFAFNSKLSCPLKRVSA